MQQASNEQTSKKTIDFDRIRAAVGPVLETHGVVLVDVEWFTDQGTWVLRLTIEREGLQDSSDPAGGVSLDDCADVSRDASTALDAEDDVIPHHYSLEVSSPGLERRLKDLPDFRRFRGKLARVKLARPVPDGQSLLRGEIAEAPDDKIAVVVDGKRIEAPFADVVEARLVFELVTQPKKQKKSTRAGKAKQSGNR
ncbi:ribosome maturation factor RimP [Polyangium mundeleinium]|uniref:Ribosome maturation factor RimP n=1 Tax=Polyangium mundeleinium TaxID=2995306 RepID=A0ABT5EPQ3_9BACT|nr:ribosome maturation factor RimP [Polyangium mundeleinium]MDC0743736.1 ribosome maturation factor RimP [Polyangium mundeleinium]